MTPLQYLAACKIKLGHCTNYGLAKKWDLDKSYISQMIRGKCPINARVAFLIATTLELDPATVLADIESQQQTGKVGEFWKSFLSHARAAAAASLCMLAFALSAGIASGQGETGGMFRRRRCCA
jgi:hypothetical protein